MNDNFSILIPSRIGSTRLANKPLVDLNGKSLIQRVFNQATKLTKDVFIATDYQDVIDHVKTFTNNVVLTSNTHISGTDRVYEAARSLEFDDDTFIINLQGDEPFVPVDLLELILKDYATFKPDVITASQIITDKADLNNPNCVKVKSVDGFAEDFQRVFEDDVSELRHHLGIYGYKLSTLESLIKLKPTRRELDLKLEQLRFMDNNFSIYVSKYPNRVQGGIDTQDDVDKAISYLKNL